MPTEVPPELRAMPRETPATARSTAREHGDRPPARAARSADACLIVLFMALTFLLGVFPLKDADFYWHLRTGDWIRAMGRVPRIDLFTFTRETVPWIDLHWVFQVAISWVYQKGGIVGLNLAKCGVTCLAMLLLLTARKREWPVWVMVLAWLPALLVLGGRMYVRPETLTLLYLSMFLAILSRWDRYPKLSLLLPLVQVAWVNSHGLFVLGPIILSFGLIDAVVRFGFFAPERRAWWRTILVSSVVTGAACLVNPYFITGALYPLELAGTMSNPIFSRNIAELMTIPDFIRSAGLTNLPMQLHLVTMGLGALSFLIPFCWWIYVKLAGSRRPSSSEAALVQENKKLATRAKKRTRSKTARTKPEKAKRPAPMVPDQAAGWRPSLFRLLLFTAFSVLSLQATRNSHQFAAVVGTVTAWNFGEWAAFVRRRRLELRGTGSEGQGVGARLVACAAVVLVLLWVGSGLFYAMTGEGRVISPGEEPVFFAHEAARFAGGPGMPDRFLSFHNGHASLFEYYHGPKRKVYTDPRLEIAGADLFADYVELGRRLAKDEPGWDTLLNEMGRPVILVDHEHNWETGATLLRSAHWRCVWFDSIAAVFVHDSYSAVVKAHGVDFAARHFRPDKSTDSRSLAELRASCRAYRNYAQALAPGGGELASAFVWLGLDDARRLLRAEPDSALAWKALGQIEFFRERPDTLGPRFRSPFDAVSDLSVIRATHALRRASDLLPRDFSTLLSLQMAFAFRNMNEAALDVLDRLAALNPTNPFQSSEQAKNEAVRAQYVRALGSLPAETWRNLSDLDQIVNAQLAAGRAETAARLLERAYPPERASWAIIDKITTLWLQLGEPARARDILRKATSMPTPSIRDARIGTTYLAECDFDQADRYYEQAIRADPGLFEALYCQSILKQDAGDATLASEFAGRALKAAPDDKSRSAARGVVTGIARFGAQPAGRGPGAARDRTEPASPR